MSIYHRIIFCIPIAYSIGVIQPVKYYNFYFFAPDALKAPITGASDKYIVPTHTSESTTIYVDADEVTRKANDFQIAGIRGKLPLYLENIHFFSSGYNPNLYAMVAAITAYQATYDAYAAAYRACTKSNGTFPFGTLAIFCIICVIIDFFLWRHW